MAPVIKRLWNSIRKYLRPMPEEPSQVKPVQADPQRVEVGFHFHF